MMTEEKIRRTIDERLAAIVMSCSTTHIAHHVGVIRGLLWSLNDDEPPHDILQSVQLIYHLMGVPTREMGDHFHYAMSMDLAELDDPCEFCRQQDYQI